MRLIFSSNYVYRFLLQQHPYRDRRRLRNLTQSPCPLLDFSYLSHGLKNSMAMKTSPPSTPQTSPTNGSKAAGSEGDDGDGSSSMPGSARMTTGPLSTTEASMSGCGRAPGSSSSAGSGDATSAGGLDSRSPGAHSREENCLSEDNDTMDTGLGEFQHSC